MTFTNELTQQFKTDADFATSLDLYIFDKRLRLLFLDALERIEVALRVDVSLCLSERDPLSYRDPREFHPRFGTKIDEAKGETKHARWLQRFDIAVAESREDFVVQFLQDHTTPLPIWMGIELWDFGALAKIFAGMRDNDRRAISKKYGIERHELIASWLRSMNYVRNVCAHHGRLWNRAMVNQPKPVRSGEVDLLEHLVGDGLAANHLYGVAAPMQYLLRHLNPRSKWPQRLKELLDEFPARDGLKVTQTGFPDAWQEMPLWLCEEQTQDSPAGPPAGAAMAA